MPARTPRRYARSDTASHVPLSPTATRTRRCPPPAGLKAATTTPGATTVTSGISTCRRLPRRDAAVNTKTTMGEELLSPAPSATKRPAISPCYMLEDGPEMARRSLLPISWQKKRESRPMRASLSQPCQQPIHPRTVCVYTEFAARGQGEKRKKRALPSLTGGNRQRKHSGRRRFGRVVSGPPPVGTGPTPGVVSLSSLEIGQPQSGRGRHSCSWFSVT